MICWKAPARQLSPNHLHWRAPDCNSNMSQDASSWNQLHLGRQNKNLLKPHCLRPLPGTRTLFWPCCATKHRPGNSQPKITYAPAPTPQRSNAQYTTYYVYIYIYSFIHIHTNTHASNTTQAQCTICTICSKQRTHTHTIHTIQHTRTKTKLSAMPRLQAPGCLWNPHRQQEGCFRKRLPGFGVSLGLHACGHI